MKASNLGFALVLLALAALPAKADMESYLSADEGNEVRSFLVLKIPFGIGDWRDNIPSLGLDISVRSGEERRMQPERYDPLTGAREPDLELDSIKTWSLEKPNLALGAVREPTK